MTRPLILAVACANSELPVARHTTSARPTFLNIDTNPPAFKRDFDKLWKRTRDYRSQGKPDQRAANKSLPNCSVVARPESGFPYVEKGPVGFGFSRIRGENPATRKSG